VTVLLENGLDELLLEDGALVLPEDFGVVALPDVAPHPVGGVLLSGGRTGGEDALVRGGAVTEYDRGGAVLSEQRTGGVEP